jgi:hypothetical protein
MNAFAAVISVCPGWSARSYEHSARHGARCRWVLLSILALGAWGLGQRKCFPSLKPGNAKIERGTPMPLKLVGGIASE